MPQLAVAEPYEDDVGTAERRHCVHQVERRLLPVDPGGGTDDARIARNAEERPGMPPRLRRRRGMPSSTGLTMARTRPGGASRSLTASAATNVPSVRK